MRTFKAILEGATNVLSRRGWQDFNTNAIAAEAGVSVASVYQYFYDKDAVLKKLVTDLIDRDHSELLRYGSELARSGGSLDDMVAFAVSLYSHKPLLRQKLNKYNLALADDEYIAKVVSDYEGLALAFIERDHSHIQHKPIAASMVVQAVMGSCNGFLEKNPHFGTDEIIVGEILQLTRQYLCR